MAPKMFGVGGRPRAVARPSRAAPATLGHDDWREGGFVSRPAFHLTSLLTS